MAKYTNVFDKLKNLPAYIKAITNITTQYDDLIDKNRLGAGDKKNSIVDMSDDMGMMDIIRGIESKERGDIPYFSKAYNNRVNQLHVFASNPEIQFIINSIADDCVATNGTFCMPSIDIPTLKQEYKDKINKNFNTIYSHFGFSDKTKSSAWSYFVKWLIEGFLAFEIIYDSPTAPTKIIGFEERNASTLVPIKIAEKFKEEDENGVVTEKIRKILIWRQITIDEKGKEVIKTLPDNSIIFIAYNQMPGADGRFSYCERLIRNFNLMRTMENTRVAWSVSNSQSRIKLVIPVGSKATNKAKQALAMVTNKYKEDLTIDHQSGEVQVNGQPLLNFGKTIVLPSRNGQTPTIEGISFTGPDLSNMDIVKHFEKKLHRDSTLPSNRFDADKGGGTSFIFNAEGIPNDEKHYYKTIRRLRNQFDAIMWKPLYNQMLLDFPVLKDDMEFKTKLSMVYESDNQYEDSVQEEIEAHKLKRIQGEERLMRTDGRTPIFSKKFLYVQRHKLMTEEEWDQNEKMVKEELSRSIPTPNPSNVESPSPQGESSSQDEPDEDISGVSNKDLINRVKQRI